MKGFKLFFKILKSNIIATLAYILILIVAGFIFGLTTDLVQTRQKVVAPIYYVEINDNLINNLPKEEAKRFDYLLDNNLLLMETDDILSNGLYKYSLDYIIERKMEPQYAIEANYSQLTHGALILPSNLSKIDRNQAIYIFHTYLQDTAQLEPMNLAISKYLNTYYTLLDMSEQSDEELVNKIKSSLENKVIIDDSNPINPKVKLLGHYFNFSTYIITSIIILIIGIIIFEIKRSEVFKRISVAPYSKSYFLLGILLASILMAFGLVIITFSISAIIMPKVTLTETGLYFFLNLLLFVIPTTSLSVFLGLVLPKIEIVSIVSTVLAMAQGFFTGAFVPKEFLSQSLINLVKIFPAAYTIEINHLLILESSETLGIILLNGGFLLIYFAFFLGLSIIAIVKRRSQKE